MRRRSGFLTFLSALIPGIGYMYLGLMKKGFEIILLFFLIEPILGALGLGFIADIIKVPLWFYFFFDTFNIANKIDRGQFVVDSTIVIDRIFKNNSKNNNQYNNQNNNTNNTMNGQYSDMNNQYYNMENQDCSDNNQKHNINNHESNPAVERKKWMLIGWCIILLGILGVISKTLGHSTMFIQLREGISKYFIPLLFIVGGLLLLKKKD